MKIIVLLLLVGAVCLDYSQSVSPGFKIRLTKKGLDFVNTSTKKYLTTRLSSLNLGNKTGKKGSLGYSLTGIKINRAAVATSKMELTPASNGLSWTLSGLEADLQSNWRVEFKKGWFKIHLSGSVDVKVKNVFLSETLNLGQKGGRPSVSHAKCAVSIGGLGVTFHGSASTILNFFKGIVSEQIKELVQSKVCGLVGSLVNVNANANLAKLKVNVGLDHFLLDYSLISSPSVHSNDLETQHKGEVFWKTNKKEAPFPPDTIASLGDHSKMMYLWVTDYIANSAVYAAQTNNYLQYTVTKNMFPPNLRSYLNTTCEAICVGTILAAAGHMYPNSEVQITIQSNQKPNVTFAPDGITLSVDANTSFVAHSDNQKTHHIIDLQIQLTASVNGSVINERLAGMITSYTMRLTVGKSGIGKVVDKSIHEILQVALDNALIPSANGILQKGVVIPVTGALSFKNVELRLLDGVALIATDVDFKI